MVSVLEVKHTHDQISHFISKQFYSTDEVEIILKIKFNLSHDFLSNILNDLCTGYLLNIFNLKIFKRSFM